MRGTLADLDVLRDAAARADAVIHLAPADAETDRAAALTMVEATDVYLHTGGVWVYGDTDGVADEDAPRTRRRSSPGATTTSAPSWRAAAG